jgi:hypothetical protein
MCFYWARRPAEGLFVNLRKAYIVAQRFFDEDCTSGVMPLVLQNPSALPTVLMEQKLPTMRHHMTSTPSCTMEFTRKFECYKIFQYG